MYTLRESYRELGLLVFLVVISGFIFASLCFFIEIDEDSGFTSIPTAFYWVVITMTTVREQREDDNDDDDDDDDDDEADDDGAIIR